MNHDRFYYPDFPKTCPETLPPHIYEAFGRYLEGVSTGSFLQALLENDLREAMFRADAQSLLCLRDIVVFVHNCMPSACWGSRIAVSDWLAENGAEND